MECSVERRSTEHSMLRRLSGRACWEAKVSDGRQSRGRRLVNQLLRHDMSPLPNSAFEGDFMKSASGT